MQKALSPLGHRRRGQRRSLRARHRRSRAACSCAAASLDSPPVASARASGSAPTARSTSTGSPTAATGRAPASGGRSSSTSRRRRERRTTLYTPAYGPTTPARRSRCVEVTLSPFPRDARRTPTSSGPSTATAPARRHRRSRRAARCSSRAARQRPFLGAEAPVGQPGHGPPDPDAELGRDRRRDRRRARCSSATASRSSARTRCSRPTSSLRAHPRTAVGQLADGRIVLVAVDGRRPGYSIGMTNFELALALVRLGAVTGVGARRGGSTTMAFDGTLLNRPSDPAASAPSPTR